ncbi:MAG: sulfite reductase subunit alpha [Rhodospirillales bacterium]|nr:sulfite reductase subunit alpha [Rhodospirillales bacterium]
MNAVSPPLPLIPETAPFSAAQRSWLNGFLAGLYGGATSPAAAAGAAAAGAASAEAEDFPWHDPALELEERMALAEGRPLVRRMMAAMAQLDCGQCGYLCQSYAEAIASGAESSLSRCVPGAKATSRMLKQLQAEAPAAASQAATIAAPASTPAAREAGRPVRVLAAHRLTGPHSAKDVRHVVIDLAGSGLSYEPGDSIGLHVANDPALVAATIAALGADGQEPVPCPDGVTRPLREAFAQHCDIARPLDRTTDLLAMCAVHPAQAAALRALSEGTDGAEPADADLLDLITAFPSARPRLADLVGSLPALRPRLYSIASAPLATPGEVHLCVSVVRETRRGRLRGGIASTFLAERADPARPIGAYMQTSHFRLPADPAAPVIMCGPGTGIAPFRAFLQERARLGLKGKTWLFFGDQKRDSDFLFGAELAAWLADGTLARLDTAFSRDQAKKIYVQDRMAEQAVDLWRWLQQGAHFYVCGDAARMARDVDATLRRIAISEGGMNEAQAKDWMVSLARQGRYLRDVY